MIFMTVFSVRITDVIKGWSSVTGWEKLGFIFVMNYFTVTIIGTFLALYFKPRTWCKICPMGFLQKMLAEPGYRYREKKGSLNALTFSSEKTCLGCNACSRSCPVNLEPGNEFKSGSEKFRDTDCIRCGTCVSSCPVSGITCP